MVSRNIEMHRYLDTHSIVSSLDPLADTLVLVDSLTSLDYLTDVLRAHGLGGRTIRVRAKEIVPYIKVALQYLDQSLSSSKEVGILPAYYALLNLAKVYIILGPRHLDLPSQQWHGATYSVAAKESHSLLTETIELRQKGAIPLFYETITGQVLPVRRSGKRRTGLKLRLGDIYPFVSGIGAEYTMTTNKAIPFSLAHFYLDDLANNRVAPIVLLRPSPNSARDVKLLVGFKKSKITLGTAVDAFSGSPMAAGTCLPAHLLESLSNWSAR